MSLSLRSPHTLISDNGLQFDSKTFRRYYCDLGITNRYSTSTYPQGNGQAEAINKIIVNRLKKRLDDAKEKWVEKLSHVLWTYRTTPRRSTRETPFSRTYGAEAIRDICVETRLLTLRMSSFTSSNNDGLLGKSLDLIEGPKNICWALGLVRGRFVVRGQINSNEDVRLRTP